MNGPADWKDKKAAGCNPCGEQTLESFELCCLVETFPSRHASYEEYQETLKYAYLYAKSVTLVNTHWSVTNAVMGKNHRIGTSQSGIIDAFARHGRRTILEWCDKGYEYLRDLDEKYSDWLCIPKSIKITSVKPSGTVSLLAGVSPGIHYPHAKYYIRRIRIAKNSDLIPILREAGYNIVDDVYSTTAYAVEFPIKEPFFERSKDDVTIWEQFENAAAYQQHWSDNQVSITITFSKDEVKDIKYCLQCYEDKLKGVTLLPISEHGYQQAPYETIKKEKYEEMAAKIKPINLRDYKVEGEGEEGCTTDACLAKKEESKIKEAMAKTGCAEQVVKIEKGKALFDNICLDSEESEEDNKEK
jgi:ribonucleoside-triphosphate reductase